MAAGRFIREVRLDGPAAATGYPFDLPVVAALRRRPLTLAAGVTFLIGENGSGKSTLVEAIAQAAGFNPEGGSRHFRFETAATHSVLGQHITLVRPPGRPRNGFYLRAESFYNVATEIDRLGREPGGGDLLQAYGGVRPHERSHGESFLDLVVHRFGPRGLYVLDEPEAALSVRGCLAVLARMHELVAAGSQFIVATHSPVLLALPGAAIVEVGDDGALGTVGYDGATPVVLTRDFLADPGLFLRHLF